MTTYYVNTFEYRDTLGEVLLRQPQWYMTLDAVRRTTLSFYNKYTQDNPAGLQFYLLNPYNNYPTTLAPTDTSVLLNQYLISPVSETEDSTTNALYAQTVNRYARTQWNTSGWTTSNNDTFKSEVISFLNNNWSGSDNLNVCIYYGDFVDPAELQDYDCHFVLFYPGNNPNADEVI
jgi:hypothetical protein